MRKFLAWAVVRSGRVLRCVEETPSLRHLRWVPCIYRARVDAENAATESDAEIVRVEVREVQR